MTPPPGSRSARVTGVLFGAAGGMAVNALSDDFGYPGAAVALGLAGLVSAVFWLRRLPGGAPLPGLLTRTLLGLALVVTVAAAVRPGWAAPAILVAAVLVAVAVAVVTDLVTVFRLVCAVVAVGFGVGLAAAGVRIGLDGAPSAGILLTVLGVLFALGGALVSVTIQPTRETALGLGLISVVGGAGALASSAPSGADGWQADLALIGVAFLSGGVALLTRRPLRRGSAAVLAGGTLATGGIMSFTGRGAVFAAAIVVAGLAAAGAGVVLMLPGWRDRWARLTGAQSRALQNATDGRAVAEPDPPGPNSRLR